MSVNFDGKIREKIIGYDRTDTTSSNESKTKSKTVGAHVSFSDDDIKKLQRKREKEGWCIMCGEVKTHKKVLIRMVPEVCPHLNLQYYSCVYFICSFGFAHFTLVRLFMVWFIKVYVSVAIQAQT